MTCTPIKGESFGYLVTSESVEGLEYYVDLQESDWDGECGCDDFKMRSAERVARGQSPECKHIIAARRHFMKRWGPLWVNSVKGKKK